MKAYTDIPQSKTLSKILPLESADMAYYQWKDDGHLMSPVPFILDGMEEKEDGVFEYIPCWSLSTLLSLMICPRLEEHIKGIWNLTTFTDETLRTPIEIQDSKDPIDACVAMIEKLHELKLL